MFDRALAEDDRELASITLLAGLARPDVARWMAQRIGGFLTAGHGTAPLALELLKRLAAADLDRRELIATSEALLTSAAQEKLPHQIACHRILFDAARLPRHGWALVKLLVEAGDLEAAVAVLDVMHPAGSDVAPDASPLTRQFHAELLSLLGRHTEAIALTQRLQAADPTRADHVRNLLRLQMAAGQSDAVADGFPGAIAAHPGDWMLAFLLHRARIAPQAFHTAYSLLSPPGPEHDSRYHLHYAVSAMALSDTATAQRIARGLAMEPIPYAASFAKTVAHASACGLGQSHRLTGDPRQTVEIVKAGPGRPTVVVFLGSTGINFSFLNMRFLDRFFEERGLNAIYLRETRKAMFHQGIEGLGADEAEALLGLDRLHTQLGSSRRIHIGCSLGGYGAARYGHLANVEAVLSFAGATDLYGFASETIPRSLHTPQFLLLQKARQSISAQDARLRPLIEASQARHIQFFGAQNACDRAQAEAIADLPTVEIEAIEGAEDHFVFGHALVSGAFERRLDTLGLT
ncbi:hypothetical protein [Pseudoruegeria sp. SHC-113]|uniref:hypothetical protein n=1 Tax=Pseudoruegeria sp. SHC-113 TaxID=2855439 RepID=UPI0021BADB86|nr:hypothetical protein [Pseudoruegeria sp. SHC-113]MCT8160146.1 hypothetical protein [Pseudoruegeria sp. SHC-113]